MSKAVNKADISQSLAGEGAFHLKYCRVNLIYSRSEITASTHLSVTNQSGEKYTINDNSYI